MKKKFSVIAGVLFCTAGVAIASPVPLADVQLFNQGVGQNIVTLESVVNDSPQSSNQATNVFDYLDLNGAINIPMPNRKGGGPRLPTRANDNAISHVPSPIPVPPAVWLLGSGILGLVGVSRRKA